MGPGFLETVYEQSLAIELELRGMRCVRQYPVQLFYKGHPVGERRLDLFVEDCLVVELKAVDELHPIHTAQIIS